VETVVLERLTGQMKLIARGTIPLLLIIVKEI
jgi:hypothetical protein